MIYRVVGPNTELDFGSKVAAQQLLDNYPPHVVDKFALRDITLDELDRARTSIGVELQKRISHADDGSVLKSQHVEWLESRLEFYDKARDEVVSIHNKVAAEERSRLMQGLKTNTNEVFG